MKSEAKRDRVLVVDDEPMAIDLLSRALRRRYEVISASNAQEALAILGETSDIAVVVTDHQMPGMTGAQLLEQAREIVPATRRVVITGHASTGMLITAINSGQIHYLLQKPLNTGLLLDALAALADGFHQEKAQRRAFGQLQPVRQHSDSAELDLIHRDPLTGLINHRAFQERLREELARARRFSKPLSVIRGDIDHFEQINKGSGFRCGDEILRRIASIIGEHQQHRLRECDVVGRFAGQEFVILLPETDQHGAEVTAERIREVVASTAFSKSSPVTMSFGVAGFPEDGGDSEELLRSARVALKTAKRSGRNCVARYLPDEDSHGSVDFDPQEARLPSHHALLGELVHTLERDRILTCIYCDLSRLRRVEIEYGVTQHAQLFRKAGYMLTKARGSLLPDESLLCRTQEGDGYLCFIGAGSNGSVTGAALQDKLPQITALLEESLIEEMRGLTNDLPQVAVGSARVIHNAMIRGERLIGRLVDEARQTALLEWNRVTSQNKSFLQELIISGRLRSFYQPIVDLHNGATFGFEALARGPVDSPMCSPAALFSVADAVDLTVELDRACFRTALKSASECKPTHRLFLNLLPHSFHDGRFVEYEILKTLERMNLTPANIVFEITERLAIENFPAFRQALTRYTDLGFGVAIDDVGTRHSNFEAVMTLKPHFIKLSGILTHGVSTSPLKREMVASLKRIADATDAVTVAEGIEKADDLAVLTEIGVRFGQGFLLARPGPELVEVESSKWDELTLEARTGSAAHSQNTGVEEPAEADMAPDQVEDEPSDQHPTIRITAEQTRALAEKAGRWKPLGREAEREGSSLLKSLRSKPASDGFDDEPTRSGSSSPVN